MARKKIGTIKRSGGLSSLIGETDNTSETKSKPDPSSEQDKPLVKTFNIYAADFDFLNEYARYRSFVDKTKFTHKDVLHEALGLLRIKVENKMKKEG